MVDKNADETEVEQAYRERIKEVHPDQGGSTEEFQLVKAAYEEIESASAAQRGDSQDTRRSQTGNSLRCSECSSPIQSATEATYHEPTDEIFCSDCVVETYCRLCESELLLTVDQFTHVNGNPICSDCNQNRQNRSQNRTSGRQHSRANSQSNETTTILDRNVALFWLLLAGMVIAIGVWYYRPTIAVTLTPDTREMLITAVRAVPGLGILIYFVLRMSGSS